MAKSDSPFAISALAAKVHTVGEARAVLGRAAEILREAYEKLPEISGLAGLQEETQRQLDIANAYAQGIYAIYAGATPDLFEEEISFQNAARVGLALERARQALRATEEATETEWWDFVSVLQAALDAVATAVKWTASTAAATVVAAGAPLLSAFWPYLLLAGIVAILYFGFGKRALSTLADKVTA